MFDSTFYSYREKTKKAPGEGKAKGCIQNSLSRYSFESQLCKLKSISFHILILNFNACIRSGWKVICFIYGSAQQIQQNDSFLPNLHHLESFGKILCSSTFRIAHVRSNRCILEIFIIECFWNNFTYINTKMTSTSVNPKKC